jgi:hypothetical protein
VQIVVAGSLMFTLRDRDRHSRRSTMHIVDQGVGPGVSAAAVISTWSR